jgi:hypothetical protein
MCSFSVYLNILYILKYRLHKYERHFARRDNMNCLRYATVSVCCVNLKIFPPGGIVFRLSGNFCRILLLLLFKMNNIIQN